MAKRKQAAYRHPTFICTLYVHGLSPQVPSPLPPEMTFCHPLLMKLHTGKKKQI